MTWILLYISGACFICYVCESIVCDSAKHMKICQDGYIVFMDNAISHIIWCRQMQTIWKGVNFKESWYIAEDGASRYARIDV